jgi:hypothetical protein
MSQEPDRLQLTEEDFIRMVNLAKGLGWTPSEVVQHALIVYAEFLTAQGVLREDWRAPEATISHAHSRAARPSPSVFDDGSAIVTLPEGIGGKEGTDDSRGD